MKSAILAAAIATTFVGSAANAAATRDYISIVGSSTVYPFATVVAERFGKTTKYKTPKIESTGSGGGMKLFCAGVGVQHPDITNASRRIKKSEFEKCHANGVSKITEVKVGYDGIAIANSKKAEQLKLSRKDIFLALAAKVPNTDGSETLIDNPYKTWKEVNADLPNMKIEVLGPPPTSGTRDAFAELAMEGGCKTFPFIKAMKKKDKKAYKAACHTVREDGAYIEAGENDNLIVQKLAANPAALGVFGYSYLEENSDKIQGSIVDGVAAEFESISDGSYPLSRPLYFYVKDAHVGKVPGVKGYVAEFTSNKAWGDDGYLAERGLVPMPKAERMKFAKDAKELNNLSM